MEIPISNAEFISAIFPEDANVAVCSKKGDPTEGGWLPQLYSGDLILGNESNNYVNSSCFQLEENGVFNVQKKNWTALHFILLDDLGTKVTLDRLGDFKLTWLTKTSPNNFQGGIVFKAPLTDLAEAESVQKSILNAGYGDRGAGGVSRWARLHDAINGKQKYLDEEGNPFQCKLVEWNPETRYTVQELIDGLQLTIPEMPLDLRYDNEVYTPKAPKNPVIEALKDRGLYKTPLGSGKHDITCPWKHEHTDQLDSGTAYFESDDNYAIGGFNCFHSHEYHIHDLLNFLGIKRIDARHKPSIRIIDGELHSIVGAAEKALASTGKYFQRGGLIVRIVTDSISGMESTMPIKQSSLACELSSHLAWEKYDSRSKGWKPADPPQRHIGILYDSQNFRHLPILKHIARQPYFCEITGELVTETGYNERTQLFGIFDARKYVIPDSPTKEDALAALKVLQELIEEFHFSKEIDRAATLGAIFTAALRSSLDLAPAIHVKASAFGIGKSMLTKLIALFATSVSVEGTTYASSTEEATKSIISLLLDSPAVVDFDDLDDDLKPHGVFKRALTSETLKERVLGHSKTVTVSTRTLFLSSGNNIDALKDLRRRVLTITLDAKVQTPSMLTYKRDPILTVKANREHYVGLVITIVKAWKVAGCPKSEIKSLATYNGKWTDYCRHPLMWLGVMDPATSLFEQIMFDPDLKRLGVLLIEWYKCFNSNTIPVRDVIKRINEGNAEDLLEAILEFSVTDRGVINNSKFGWMLKKHANRVVDGLRFEQVDEPQRVAWRVVRI
jgi:hypothetical protein